MIYKQPSIDIIGDLIASLTFPVTIIQAVNNGSGVHTLSVCDMYHAQPGFYVMIGSKKYLITDIQPAEQPDCDTPTNDVMVIKGESANITATTFNMYSPFFFYGTPMAEGTELSQVNQAKDKTPMYWLRLDDFSEKFFENEMETKERELKFRLYPLTQSDHEKWVTSEAKKQAIDPMHRLAEIFVNAVKANPARFNVNEFTWDIPAVFPKFGVISINRGVEKSLWHDKLGGVELSMSLTVLKKEGCEICP